MDDVTFDKIRDAVLGLGVTADGIAEALRLEGIKAKPCDARACALTAYTQKHWPEVTNVRTSHVTQVFHAGASYRRKIELTDAHTKFVLAFDNGEYPDLVADE